MKSVRVPVIFLLACVAGSLLMAQAQQAAPTPNDNLVSVDLQSDRHVTFRIYAPRASKVAVSGDFRAGAGPADLTKQDNGVWSATLGPLAPNLYSYNFTVDGVRTTDQKNNDLKTGQGSMTNLFLVPGAESDFLAMKPVAHGDVRTVWYPSKVLGIQRRMHVYTPSGYDSGTERYPVFYLLHGGGDDDMGWTSVGRAQFILDNLIAEGKAKPMIVVMPAGHFPGARVAPGGNQAEQDKFANEFWTDMVPFVEGRYRAKSDRYSRAIAGLSMGGSQTMRIAFPHMDKFGYIAIWSQGVNSTIQGEWEKQNAQYLDNVDLRKSLKVFQVAIGDNDQQVGQACKNFQAILKKHEFAYQYHESGGGHTWDNWRHYLNLYAPQLFN